MNNKDLVSIIIPSYNRAKTIKKAVVSCLEQTYQNIEVIVVDDGSTDKTKEVVKAIRDNRVKYYSYKNNKGACYARNYGIKKAKGKYITFNDSDDVLVNHKIDKQIRNLIDNKSDMDFCKIELIMSKDNKFIYPNNEQDVNIKHNIINELVKGNFISTQSIFVKKSVITRYMFDESLPRLQDYDLVLRMVPNIIVSYSAEVLAHVYRSSDSISNNYSKLADAVYKMIRKKYDLSDDNNYVLFNLLINTLFSHKEQEYNLYKQSQDKKYKKLLDDYNKTLSEFNELKESKEHIEELYENVITSKRYRFISNLLSFKNSKKQD